MGYEGPNVHRISSSFGSCGVTDGVEAQLVSKSSSDRGQGRTLKEETIFRGYAVTAKISAARIWKRMRMRLSLRSLPSRPFQCSGILSVARGCKMQRSFA